MTRYLLDTGIAADYIHRRRNVYERARDAVKSGHRIGIGMPVLAELWHGVENSSNPQRNADRLRRVLPELIVWPVTTSAAEEYGRIAAELKRIGRPIGRFDMLISAIAKSMGNTMIVSADADFQAVPGLTVENWGVGQGKRITHPLV